LVHYVDERKEYRLVDPCRNNVVVNKDVRINENSDLNQNDDHWFEDDKSTDLQGNEHRRLSSHLELLSM